jgi:lipid II:glycine glycyltransferase (peptidoglycan interpeptide bridge formation enzyme)
MFLARHEGEIVGANLVLINDYIAYAHLAAYTNEGYNISASYGNYWSTLVYCKQQGIRYFNLGGVAGHQEDPMDGLAKFKRGWSNERRKVYLCGRVFDSHKYESICLQYQIPNIDYFPAYRGLIRS